MSPILVVSLLWKCWKEKEVICWSLSTNPLWGEDIYCSTDLDLRGNCIKYTSLSLKVNCLSLFLALCLIICVDQPTILYFGHDFTMTNCANVWKQFPVFINITVNVLWCIWKKFQYSIQQHPVSADAYAYYSF